ncbi:hypothetical protein HDU93_003562 [Gonapodya sp. JEL0774]|nr:hypothetical protein HDU93_003562 [Gonapodya sp. JEL0774]
MRSLVVLAIFTVILLAVPQPIVADDDGRERHRHVLEHLPQGKDKFKFSANEEIYVMFLLHDIDRDGKLDGIELRAMITDSLSHDAKVPIMNLEEADYLVEKMLDADDSDGE